MRVLVLCLLLVGCGEALGPHDLYCYDIPVRYVTATTVDTIGVACACDKDKQLVSVTMFTTCKALSP